MPPPQGLRRRYCVAPERSILIVYLSFGDLSMHWKFTAQSLSNSIWCSNTQNRISAWLVPGGLVPLTQAVDSRMPALRSLGLGPEGQRNGSPGNVALVMFPTVLTGAVSTNMVLAVSAALARDDWDRIQDA